jgi:hypothetical protein
MQLNGQNISPVGLSLEVQNMDYGSKNLFPDSTIASSVMNSAPFNPLQVNFENNETERPKQYSANEVRFPKPLLEIVGLRARVPESETKNSTLNLIG